MVGVVDGVIYLTDLLLWAICKPTSLTPYMWVVETLMKVCFNSGLLALAYLAFEPFVRQRWPWHLVGWTRLLGGRWRDPLIGRDVLTGALVGSALIAVVQVTLILPTWLGLPPELPIPIMNWGNPFGQSTSGLLRASLAGITLTFVMVFVSRILRTGWLWVPVLIGLLMLFVETHLHQWLFLPLMLVCCAAVAWVFCRRGLLAFMALCAVAFWHAAGLITLDLNTDYWLNSLANLTMILLTLGYALVVSVGGWRKLVRADTAG